MQLGRLEDFIELANTRSFTRAAENRFVTHPAFGRRIRALEQWVGTRLIERSQPLKLTAAGMVFLDAANNALEVLLNARTQLQDTAATLRSNLKVATGRTLASTFFPDWYQDAVRRVARHVAELPALPPLRPTYQSDSYESIMAMAKLGAGLAWLPQRLVRDSVDRGELAVVGEAEWQFSVDISLYRRRDYSHRVLDSLWPQMTNGATAT